MSSEAATARRALLWLGGGTVLASVLQYVLLFAAARQLGVTIYGEFALALAFSLLLAPLCDLGTSVAIVCTGAQRPTALGEQCGGALRWRLCALLPTLGLGLGLGAVAGYGEVFLSLFPPLLVAAIGDGTVALLAAVCQVQGRVRTAAGLQVGRNLSRALAVLATVALGGGALALALAFAVAVVPVLVIGLREVGRGVVLDLDSASMRSALRTAWPFGFSSFGTVIHGQVAVVMLGVLADEREVGGYHAAVRFLLLLLLLPQVTATALAPLAYRRALDGIAATASIYRLKLTALGFAGVLASLGLAAGGVELVEWSLGAAFSAAGPLLSVLAPVVFLKFLNSCLGDSLSEIGQIHQLGVAYWLAALAQVALAPLLLPSLGALGAVVLVVIGELFLLAFLVLKLGGAGFALHWFPVLWRPLVVAAVGAGCSPWLGPWAFVVGCVVAAATVWCRPSAEQRALLPWRSAPTA